MERLLTADDVAEALQVTAKTVYERRREWGMKPVRIGGGRNGALRFRTRDVERLAKQWECE